MFASDSLRVSEYTPHEVMAPHCHREASLGVIVGGDFVERIGKSERHYVTGSVSLEPAGIDHSQTFGVHGARQIITTADDAWLSYLADCRMRLAEAPFARTPALYRLGQKLAHELKRPDALSALACEGIVLEIVAAFGRVGFDATVGASIPLWLHTALDYLHVNACAAPTMKQIALAAGRHEIHLAREFRRYFGTSVGGYLRRLKTAEAARLLRLPGADITDIALQCGFASHAHLCRVFKAHFGVTPSQYRAKN